MYRSGTDVDNRSEYTLMQSMSDSKDAIEAIVNSYIASVMFAGNIPEELKITEKEIQDRAELEIQDDEVVEEEEEEESRYATDDIIAVTYGTLDGEAYKTMLLNYNNYVVTLVYEGVRYTIGAYSFVVIKR